VAGASRYIPNDFTLQKHLGDNWQDTFGKKKINGEAVRDIWEIKDNWRVARDIFYIKQQVVRDIW
jgi:hypothetical protein